MKNRSKVAAATVALLLTALAGPWGALPALAATTDDQPQTITFDTTAPSPGLVGQTYAVAAHGGGSGNPVVLSLGSGTTGGACTVSDNGDGTASVSLLGAGTCEVQADQAGSEGFEPAPTAQQAFDVRRAQSITFTTHPPSPAYVGSTYVASATSDSGAPVVVSLDPSSAPGACSISATQRVTFTGVGTCVVRADQAGDSQLAPAQALDTFQILNRSQVIRFTTTAPVSPSIGAVYKLKAQGGASGNEIRFSVGGSTVGSCTVTRTGTTTAKVTFTGRGTCRIDADQDGATGYDPAATVSQTATVAGKAQRLAFTSKVPTRPAVGQTYTVAARGGASGQPVTFSIDPSSTAGACTVGTTSGSAVVTFEGRGSCVVDADQAGDGVYAPAPTLQQSLTVVGAAQQVTVTSVKQKRYPVDTTYTVAATGGGSGEALTFRVDGRTTNAACELDGSGSATSAGVAFRHAGTCVIAVGQPGNASFEPAPDVLVTMTVTPAAQTIVYDVAPPASAAVGRSYEVRAEGGASGEPVRFAVDSASSAVCSVQDQTAADGSPLPSGALLTTLAPGRCVLLATQAGNGDYAAAPVKRSTSVVS